MKKDLAKLQKIDLRDVWDIEPDFTNWLAQKENLDLLGEEIGVDIKIMAHRERVWVILYFLKHTGKDFESQIFLISATVSPSLNNPDLVIEPLYKSQRYFVFRPTVCYYTIPAPFYHLCKSLVRLELLPFERFLPVVEKLTCPAFCLITP